MNRSRPGIVPFLDVRIEQQRRGVAVVGLTELPEGTILRCGLWPGPWDGPFDEIAYLSTTVHDGKSEALFPIPSWSGQTSASIELLANHTQPDEVRAVIGPTGEHVQFADFIGSDFAAFVATCTVSLGRPEVSGAHEGTSEPADPAD